MVTEKNIFNKKEFLLKCYAYTSISIVAVIYFSYIYISIGAMLGTKEPLKVVDILSAIGQIATALAFILAVRQYQKNSKEQKQLAISNEAKSLISQMIVSLGKIKTKEETDLDNLNHGITELTNIASNFDELFGELEEDVHKAIVRMQWQNMYFNNLRRTLYDLSIEPILLSTKLFSKQQLEELIIQSKQKAIELGTPDCFVAYKTLQILMNSEQITSKYSLNGKIDSIDLFTSYFLNDHNLNDLFYGLMSRVNIRVIAPIFAVAEPAEWALSDNHIKSRR